MLFGHRTQEPDLLAIDAAPFAEQSVIAQPQTLEGRECAVKGNRLKTSSLFATWRKLMNPSNKGSYSVRRLLHFVLRRRASNVHIGCIRKRRPRGNTLSNDCDASLDMSAQSAVSPQIQATHRCLSGWKTFIQAAPFFQTSWFPGSAATPYGRDAASPKDYFQKCSAWRKSPCFRGHQLPET